MIARRTKLPKKVYSSFGELVVEFDKKLLSVRSHRYHPIAECLIRAAESGNGRLTKYYCKMYPEDRAPHIQIFISACASGNEKIINSAIDNILAEEYVSYTYAVLVKALSNAIRNNHTILARCIWGVNPDACYRIYKLGTLGLHANPQTRQRALNKAYRYAYGVQNKELMDLFVGLGAVPNATFSAAVRYDDLDMIKGMIDNAKSHEYPIIFTTALKFNSKEVIDFLVPKMRTFSANHVKLAQKIGSTDLEKKFIANLRLTGMDYVEFGGRDCIVDNPVFANVDIDSLENKSYTDVVFGMILGGHKESALRLAKKRSHNKTIIYEVLLSSLRHDNTEMIRTLLEEFSIAPNDLLHAAVYTFNIDSVKLAAERGADCFDIALTKMLDTIPIGTVFIHDKEISYRGNTSSQKEILTFLANKTTCMCDVTRLVKVNRADLLEIVLDRVVDVRQLIIDSINKSIDCVELLIKRGMMDPGVYLDSFDKKKKPRTRRLLESYCK